MEPINMETTSVIQTSLATAVTAIGSIFGIQKVIRMWRISSVDLDLIKAMHEELNRLNDYNKVLSEELGKVQNDFLKLNREMRELSNENQHLNTEVNKLTNEVQRLNSLVTN